MKAGSILLIAILCSSSAQQSRGQQGNGAVQFQIKNVHLMLARDIALEVAHLRGQLERTNASVPVTFDDGASFVVNIDSASVAVTAASMTALMNSYVFAYEGAPIKNVTMTIEGDRLVQKGTIHKGIDLPFEMEGSLSPTPEGNIRVHADKIKAAHVPAKGLLHFLGEDLEKLIKQRADRGVVAEGDDLILEPRMLTPPPHLQGRVTRVTIANDKIVMEFDSGHHTPSLTPPFHTAAYIYHRGGILRFGKLTMNDADLEIVGDRPGTFEFFQREYKKQLVAGYSKNTSSGGLVAHMVDYSRIDGRR